MALGVAIVGISVELPSGSYSEDNLDHKSFFEFLLKRGDAYEQLPSDRFNIEAWNGNGLGEIHVSQGAFLKHIDLFDNVEFGISSRDARAMAPVTRKLLENSFLALLDSGINFRSRNVGCYTSGNSFELSNVSDPDEYEARGSFAGGPAMVANRISMHLDLLGPSVPTDTACSSTLTALHLAIQAIMNGDCEAAVVGGCQLNHRLMDWITYSQGSLLAKDGKCKPFDSSADGFARAEGCVVIVIKLLEDALRDHDRIYATILGTSINSTGAAAPPGAPVAESQCDVMLQAFKRAGRRPQDVDYVELHATGTAKGDPTEANWVGEYFQRDRELLIGSVKGNIGHTEIAAFLASLSKVISIFEQSVIPPNVNIRTLNPAIKWDQYKLKVPLDPTSLPRRPGVTPLISMASSGIGGSNGHVVIEAPPASESLRSEIDDSTSGGPVLLMASGLSPRTASSIAQSITDLVANDSMDLYSLSTIMGRRARQMSWRSYAIASATSSVTFSSPEYSPRAPRPLVFVFSGQGPQHNEMGRELFRTFKTFKDNVLEMDVVFKRMTNKSIIYDYGLFGEKISSDLPDKWPIFLILSSITIFQIALFDLLVSLGVTPDIVVGHSAGETAVLYTSGAACKTMAVEMAIIRGKSFLSVEELGGSMAALSCSQDEASLILAQEHSENPDSIVELACFNSPSAVAISGQDHAINRVLQMACAQGIYARKIRTSVPIHSSMMDVCREEYLAGLRELFCRFPGPHYPKIPTYSTLTGELFSGSFDAEYFWNNTRSQVLFTQAIGAIMTSHNPTFVEIAPHPVLSSYVSSMVPSMCPVLSTVRRPKPGSASSEHRDMLEFCGKLIVAGYNSVDFTSLNGRAAGDIKLTLPPYPFLKKQYPLYPDTPGHVKQMRSRLGPINHKYLKMNKDTHPTLGEHVIRGEPIMPAAGYFEMAIEFGAPTLMNINLSSILSLSAHQPVQVDIQLDGSHWTVKSTVRSHRSQKGGEPIYTERLHADGYLSFEQPQAYPALDIPPIRERCHSHVGAEFYSSLSYFSTYGPRLQRVTNVYYGADEALASIKGIDNALAAEGNYILHPAILDACGQVTTYRPFHGDFNPNTYYLPARLEALLVHRKLKAKYFPPHIYAHLELKGWTPDAMYYDIALVDDLGGRLCTLLGLEVAKHQIHPSCDISSPFQIVLQPAIHSERSIHTASEAPVAMIERTKVCNDVAKSVAGAEVQKSHFPELNGLSQHKICEKQSYIFDMPDIDGSLSNTTSEQLEIPSYDQATLTSCDALQNAIADLMWNSCGRMVRLFVISNDDSLFGQIAPILQEFPSLFTELFVKRIDQLELLHISPKLGVVRFADLDLLKKPETNIPDSNSFDIVLAFNLVTAEIGSRAVFDTCNDLLLPGGTLILTERTRHTINYSRKATTLLDSYLDVFKNAEFSLINLRHGEDANQPHFTIESQKPVLKPTPSAIPSVFDASDAFVFSYTYGKEIDLQWDFSGLNMMQELDIWIVTNDGRDGGSALGMVRALRREYLLWSIRLVIFPPSFTEERRLDCLARLPSSVKDEVEIVISLEGNILVPRMIPLPQLNISDRELRPQPTSSARKLELPLDHILVRVNSSSTYGNFSGFLASVTDGNSTCLAEGTFVLGLTTTLIEEYASVDVATVSPVSSRIAQHASAAALCIPGFIAAVLALGTSTLNYPSRLKSIRMLLTHSDTNIGLSISHFYSSIGVNLVRVTKDVSLLDLSLMGRGSFQLIVSGYTGRSHLQVLGTLLQPRRGKLFLWDDKITGLAGILERDPCSIGDALGHAVSYMSTRIHDLEACIPRLSTRFESFKLSNITRTVTPCAVFDANKSYVVLGGIGNIGAHMAVFMYKRGARHIVLTSRSGEKSLYKNKNLLLRRIFKYLQGLSNLQIRLEAIDATSKSSMDSLISSLHPALGGCIVLTAILEDRVFQHLDTNNFSNVFASKIGVLDTIIDSVDIPSLEFLVAFSSVSGLFGTGGQSNYGAANTAIEEGLTSFSNAFSFVCPGILDSTVMLASNIDENENRLSHLVEWSLSSEDMMIWFEDAVCRFQNGQTFHRYIPNLNWEAMDRTLGMTKLGSHLILPTEVSPPVTFEGDIERMGDIVMRVLSISRDDFSTELPLTAYGIDSLSASRLSALLRPIVEVTQIQLLADVSLNDLQRMIPEFTVAAITQGHDLPARQGTSQHLMNELLAKYTKSMDNNRPLVTSLDLKLLEPSSSQVVLLTGSTGALGSNLLAYLLRDIIVEKVYAFNRKSSDGTSLLDRQISAFETQGHPSSLALSNKLVLVEGDLTADDLGILKETMDTLLSSVTHIIHNAWKIDFFTPLADFEDMIQGTRKLLDLAIQSKLPLPPSLSFISSIGVSQRIQHVEAPILDAQLAVQTGYIESKWVGERLFQIAAEKLSLRTNVIRVGLLTGGENGAWDTSHWLPALAQSAVYVGCLPDGDDVVSWLPLDLAARAILDMRNVSNETLHLIHPQPVTWSAIMKPLASMLGVPLVPYVEWFARLESMARDESFVTQSTCSALKLIDFYRLGLKNSANRESMGLLPKVSFEKGLCSSEILMDARVSTLGIDDVVKWVEYWHRVGFFRL